MNNKNFLSKNQLLKYKKLLNKKNIKIFQKFIVEGLHLIEESLKHKNLLDVIITSDYDYQNDKVKVLYTTYENISKLNSTKTPQKYLGICNILKFNQNINDDKVLILNKINDPGNLGTIIRTAYSFGIKDIIVEGVDIYNPKVLRSTQGAIFNVNIFNLKNLEDFIINLKQKKYKIIGSLLKNSIDYNKLKINDKKIAIVLGNESKGIENKIIKLLDYKVYIPIKFESLNVAVACGILLSKYCNK